MIVDAFPKSGAVGAEIKTKPIHYYDSVDVYYSTGSSADFEPSAEQHRQLMACDSTGALYVIAGSGYTNYHFLKLRPEISHLIKEWSFEQVASSVEFWNVVVGHDDCPYILRATLTIEKYSPDGELLWSTEADSDLEEFKAVLCIGTNGNLFVWSKSYIKEYDPNGTLVSTINYTDSSGYLLCLYIDENKNLFIASSTEIKRVNADLETVWAIPFDCKYDRARVCVDNSGNFFFYDRNGEFSVTRVSPDGEVLWTFKPKGYVSDVRPAVAVDNKGAVYAISYSERLFKLDAETGLELWREDDCDYPYYLYADSFRNAYSWSAYGSIHMLSARIGTVQWTEEGVDREKYILREIESGDGYLLLKSDEEVPQWAF